MVADLTLCTSSWLPSRYMVTSRSTLVALAVSRVVGRGWRAVAVTTAMSSANGRSVGRRGYGATST